MLPDTPGEPEQLAGSAAGLLALVCIMARDRAHQVGVRTIHFLTREGIFFQRFFDKFSRAALWTESSSLFHGSRLSTFSASLTFDGWRGLERFFSQYHDANWTELLASLNSVSNVGDRVPACAAPSNLRGQALFDAIGANQGLREWIDAIASRDQLALEGYVSSRHPEIINKGAAILVDIGWRGTIQDNLALALPTFKWHGVYFGLRPYLNPQPTNCSKSAILFGPDSSTSVTADVFATEFLFHSASGSVIAYRAGEPILDAPRPAVDDFTGRFQSVLADHAAKCGAMYAEAMEAGTQEALKAAWQNDAGEFWDQTQAMGPALFDAIRRFHHDETFGVGNSIQIDAATSLRAMLRSLVSYRTRRLFLQHSLAIPPHLRRSSQLGWWLRAWLHFHATASKARKVLRNRP